MSKQPTGQLYHDKTGIASYHIAAAEADFIHTIVSSLQNSFPNVQIGSPINGLDAVYVDVTLDSVPFAVGWDIWMGCFVFARSEGGNHLVSELATHFDALLRGI